MTAHLSGNPSKGYTRGTDSFWRWAHMKKIFGVSQLEEARSWDCCSKHHELKSFGRFWYQEIRDCLNSKRTVQGISWQDFWRSHAPRFYMYGMLRTVHPGIRKSRISWYQNRPKDFSSSCFFIDDAQLRASSSCAKPNSFFIGAHGQELSVPRNSTLIKMPRNRGIGSSEICKCRYADTHH